MSTSIVAEGWRWHLRRLVQHRELLESLIVRDVRARYKQTVLGFAWAVLNPVAQMIVFSVVFSRIVKVPTGGADYPIFSYVALLPWTLFASGVSGATSSLVMHQGLITKVAFPREVLPLAAVLGRIVDFFIACSVLALMMLVYGIGVTPALILAAVVLLIQLTFTVGIGLLLSAINLFYRDVSQAIALAMTLWMYATPVIYPETLVPEAYRWLYMLNPMAVLISSYRTIVIGGSMPDPVLLGLAAVQSLLLLTCAYALFKRWEPLFADMV